MDFVSRNKWRSLFELGKRHLLTVSFFLGFIIDSFTLNRIDQTFDIAVLLFYIILTMVSMILLYGSVSEKYFERLNPFFKKWSPYLIQYSFGGLLSGMLIFYGRSGAFYESWPFMLMIIAAVYGNETIKDRATRLVYNLGMFFVGMFALVVLMVPVFLGKMGPLVFMGSGLIALTIMYWFVRVLTYMVPNFMALQRKSAVFTIGIIFAVFNFLYFANIIPPIPLSLKEVGIYHGVVRFDNDTYQVTYEKPKWWEFSQDSDKTFHSAPGDNIFCFASVFAPTRLATNIYHRWEFYNEKTKNWIDHGRYAYAISGGRGDGFRGYTMISNYEEGAWRCTVETERGQSLGRVDFEVVPGEKRELVTQIK